MTFSPFLAPERDGPFKRGRPKTGTNYYILPGVVINEVATETISTGTDYYGPIFVETPIVVDRLACDVQTGAVGNVRIGLYRADVDWQPIGAPLADSGNMDTSGAGVLTFDPATAITLGRGRYLTVLNSSAATAYSGTRGTPPGAQPIALSDLESVGRLWRVARAYAAFPTPGTAWNTVSNSTATLTQLVVLRVTVP